MSARELVRDGAARLAAAGVPSPEADAESLLAHVLGCGRAALVLARPDDAAAAAYERLLEQRALRVPLAHLTGTVGFRRLELHVGPGVFVPRPETELLAGWAAEAAREAAGDEPATVVDLCTGSGAIAAAVADEAPGSRVLAVERDPVAADWARRNIAGTGVRLEVADLADAAEHLRGRVDVVVSNPPYVPVRDAALVDVETSAHDPGLALWGGEDGLDVVRRVVARAEQLLRPGGRLGCEHDASHGPAVVALLDGSGTWEDARTHVDLAGRPRWTTARLRG